MTRPVALTGTPGTGKSAVAGALPEFRCVEVADLAREWGAARERPDGLEVNLARLRRAARDHTALRGVDLVVGHLAHLLPLRDVVVLRCHPGALARRLARRRRTSPAAERRENVVAEATDLILLEALRPGRRLWEIDTTDRTVVSVARQVARRVRGRGPSAYGKVRWLEDAAVTDYLLDRGR
jgi:adenylate kinase